MRTLFIVTVLFVLCGVLVSGYGVSGEPYTYFNFEKCAGNYTAQVYSPAPVQYSLPNCTYVNNSIWECPCSKEAVIISEKGILARYSIKLQYYIETPRVISNPNPTHPTQDEVYNDNLRRVWYVKDIIIYAQSDKEIEIEKQQAQDVVNNILLVVFGVVVLFILVLVLFVLYYFNRQRIRGWLRLEPEEKITFKKILIAVFSRPKIQRKVGKRDSKQSVVNETTEDKVDENAANEIRKILGELDK